MRTLLLLLFIQLLLPDLIKSTWLAAETRPNIIIFISDDQHWNDLKGVMPETERRIFDAGVNFTRAYITTPICCPSRASIFTGLYSTQHGVLANSYPLKQPTIVNQLKQAGYFTGIMGKYLNSWDGSYRAEFDFWRVFKGGNAVYFDTLFNENGSWVKKTGYVTDIMEEYAREFLSQAKASGKPFILFVTPQIPHRPAIPHPKYEQLYSQFVPYAPPNIGCDKRKGKPNWIRKAACQPTGKPALVRVRKSKSSSPKVKFQLRQRQTLRSFDDLIGAMLSQLDQNKQTDKTALFYISDNGLLRASFGLVGKMYPYEDSIKVPFAFSYPPLTAQAARTEDRLVGNIDIAPTILQLVGLKSQGKLSGKSLVGLVSGSASAWRDELLIESQFRGRLDGVDRTPFAGLRTKRYAFFVSRGDRPELYDMNRDPAQLDNIVLKRLVTARKMFVSLKKLRPDIILQRWMSPRYWKFFQGTQ